MTESRNGVFLSSRRREHLMLLAATHPASAICSPGRIDSMREFHVRPPGGSARSVVRSAPARPLVESLVVRVSNHIARCLVRAAVDEGPR
jgi:hypothetical protein